MGIFGSKEAEVARPLSILPTAVAAPMVAKEGGMGGGVKIVLAVLGGMILLYLGLLFYNWLRKRQGLTPLDMFNTEGSGDVTPTPIDGKTRTVIPAGDLPPGQSGDSGVQFWMFIKDWDYRFGQTKEILKRVASTNASIVSPRISLSPSENTLDVAVSLFPTGGAAGTTAPGVEGSGDIQICSVENVPLQSWFSVSATIFQRNLDIYINGRLVKSCVLKGVPRVAMGDIILADKGGFSGSICNVNAYGKMLNPEDAQVFYTRGTKCAAPASTETPIDKDSWFITLFGYTFRFSTFNKEGKEVSSYTF